jgi:hypothetical protein
LRIARRFSAGSGAPKTLRPEGTAEAQRDQELSWDGGLIQPFLRNGRNPKLALPALKRRAIVGQSLRDNKPDLCWGWRLREALDSKKVRVRCSSTRLAPLLKTGVITERYERAIVVPERQKSGRVHWFCVPAAHSVPACPAQGL